MHRKVLGLALCAGLMGGCLVPAYAQDAPPLLDREAWRAKPALPGMRPQEPYSIIVHHTGEKQNPRLDLGTKLRGLQGYSQRPADLGKGRRRAAWPDLPYHFYIGVDGTIGEGRNVRFAGDTNTGYDTKGHVQVVLEGNFEVETPTPQQLSALKQVLLWQAAAWKVPVSKITVHRDHARTACPGKNLMTVLPQLLAELRMPP